MYISDSPCGDASIYNSNKQDGSVLSFTGAKLLNINADENDLINELLLLYLYNDILLFSNILLLDRHLFILYY